MQLLLFTAITVRAPAGPRVGWAGHRRQERTLRTVSPGLLGLEDADEGQQY